MLLNLLEDYRLAVGRRSARPTAQRAMLGGAYAPGTARRNIVHGPPSCGLSVGLTTPPRKILILRNHGGGPHTVVAPVQKKKEKKKKKKNVVIHVCNERLSSPIINTILAPTNNTFN
jgi:hypothetical protein